MRQEFIKHFSTARCVEHKRSVSELEGTLGHHFYECKRDAIVPLPYGILRESTDKRGIQINDFNVGDQFQFKDQDDEIIPQGYSNRYDRNNENNEYEKFGKNGLQLQPMQSRYLNLKGTKMSDKYAAMVLQRLDMFVEDIDLSYNPRVSSLTCEVLSDMFFESQKRLKSINLEGSGIRDKEIPILMQNINYSFIKYLNLNKNNLTDVGINIISKEISKSMSL